MTDRDRLDSAFRELNEAGIIALQNAGYTQSDGLDDVSQVYHEQGGPESSALGYCFYHGQDLERAEKGKGLMLAFGDVNGEEDKGIKIGKRIVATLEHSGLTVEWAGTMTERISLPTIEWRRESGV